MSVVSLAFKVAQFSYECGIIRIQGGSIFMDFVGISLRKFTGSAIMK